MKTTTTIVMSLVFLAAFLCAFNGWASKTALDIENEMMGIDATNDHVKASIIISVSLPDFPSVPPIVFAGDMDISISKSDKKLIITTEQLPELNAPISGLPDSFGSITASMNIADETLKIEWDESKNLTISPVNIDITLFQNKKPMIDFTLKNVEVSSNKVDGKTADLSFSSTLPMCNHDMFNQVLAGKQIVGMISVNF